MSGNTKSAVEQITFRNLTCTEDYSQFQRNTHNYSFAGCLVVDVEVPSGSFGRFLLAFLALRKQARSVPFIVTFPQVQILPSALMKDITIKIDI